MLLGEFAIGKIGVIVAAHGTPILIKRGNGQQIGQVYFVNKILGLFPDLCKFVNSFGGQILYGSNTTNHKKLGMGIFTAENSVHCAQPWPAVFNPSI